LDNINSFMSTSLSLVILLSICSCYFSIFFSGRNRSLITSKTFFSSLVPVFKHGHVISIPSLSALLLFHSSSMVMLYLYHPLSAKTLWIGAYSFLVRFALSPSYLVISRQFPQFDGSLFESTNVIINPSAICLQALLSVVFLLSSGVSSLAQRCWLILKA